MRILHVIDQISQKSAGGSARVCYLLAREQVRQGHTVTIYTSDYLSKGESAPEGVDVVKFHSMGRLRFAPEMMFADFMHLDVMHFHNYRTIVNLIAAGVPWSRSNPPFILQPHGSCNHLAASSRGGKVANWVWQSLIRRAAWFIADAPNEADQLAQEGASRERTSVIPVGIDPDEFANLPSRKQTRNVVFLGRLHHIKGIDLLIRAFALLNDRASTHFGNGTEQLWIIGPDEGEGVALRQLADAMGIGHQVFFPGGMYGSDKVKHLQDAAVLVGMSRYETWGLSFLEALACGTPVIMSEFCQMGKVLPDYCGMVVLFDAESCAKAIYAALDGKIPGTREQRQEWARGYGWPGIAKRIEKVYQEAIR